MTLSFYNTVTDYRALEKVKTAKGSYTGVAHNIKNSVQLSVKLPSNAFNTITQSNYCMIDSFQKYYFIESYQIENDCVVVELKQDVRANYATQIKALNCTVARNANLANGYLVDNKYTALAYKQEVTKDFPNSLDDFSFILMTVG